MAININGVPASARTNPNDPYWANHLSWDVDNQYGHFFGSGNASTPAPTVPRPAAGGGGIGFNAGSSSSGGNFIMSSGGGTAGFRLNGFGQPIVYRTVNPQPDAYLREMVAMQKRIAADRSNQINAAMKDYDELEAATRASGFQLADNAGAVYANRQLQAGINPVASGVVAAQARLPIYQQLHDIARSREETRITAGNQADALSADLTKTIAQLRLNYAQQLADFNLRQAGLDLDLSKFNAAQAAAEGASSSSRRTTPIPGGSRMDSAAAAAYQATPNFDPGYIPDFGPVRYAQGGILQRAGTSGTNTGADYFASGGDVVVGRAARAY